MKTEGKIETYKWKLEMKQWKCDEWNEKRSERKFNNENKTLEVWRKERKNSMKNRKKKIIKPWNEWSNCR